MTTLAASSTSVSLITDSGLISAYNRGPLITVFTPPATCLSTLTYANAMFFGYGGSVYYDPACFPPSSTPSQVTSNTWAMYYYSPGQCPSGWSHATTLISSFPAAPSESNIALSIGAETTAVVCCPSGYFYASNNEGPQCQSSFLTVETLFYIQPTEVQNSYIRGSVSTTVPITSYNSSGVPYNIYGSGIPILWQSSDVALFTATSLPTSTLASSANTTTAASTSAPTAAGTPSPSLLPSTGSSGLSDGAKVAIGVCVSLSVIAILTGIFFCFRYRQRRLRQRRQNQVLGVNSSLKLSNGGAVVELPSNQHAE